MSAASLAPFPAPAPTFASHHGGDAGGDDGDDPNRRRKVVPSHQIEGEPDSSSSPSQKKRKSTIRRRRPDGAPDVSLPCPVCVKRFWSHKALHGHMRVHQNRPFRGVLPPHLRRHKPSKDEKIDDKYNEKDAADILLDMARGFTEGDRRRVFPCSGCGRKFYSRQALGGHRASHRHILGCHALGKEGKAQDDEPRAESSNKKKVLIDLNFPPPDEDSDTGSSIDSSLNQNDE